MHFKVLTDVGAVLCSAAVQVAWSDREESRLCVCSLYCADLGSPTSGSQSGDPDARGLAGFARFAGVLDDVFTRVSLRDEDLPKAATTTSVCVCCPGGFVLVRY